MTQIDRQLKEVRPSLRLVAPHTFYTGLGFAVFNIVMGAISFNYLSSRLTLIGVVGIKTWAVLFECIGLLFFYSLVINNWRLLRQLMLIGICVKTAWLMELLADQKFVLSTLWLLILYLQCLNYIYFTPVNRYGK